jgi:two-component system chemotaxis sensor kinase CheA
MGEMDDVVKEFLVESYENLDRLDSDLLALETNPQAREMLASIFRTIHTIKGTCGFLGFARLESLAHVGESLLSLLRDGKLGVDAQITTGLLQMVDAVRRLLANIENNGAEGDEDFAALKAQLTLLQGGHAAAAKKPAAAPTASAATAPTAPAAAAPAPTSAPSTPAPPPAAPIAVEPVAHATETPTPAPAPHDEAPSSAAAASKEPAPSKPAAHAKDGGASVADNSIRVDVGQLDKLMNLVGELVLARNQVLQLSSHSNDNAFVATTQRLNLITTELQESVMKTRMQPIMTVWGKLPRVVRDVSAALGKQIQVEMYGKETELDKTILEAIKDPLTHIVRNSCDHGIETPAVRAERGKPAEGRLTLRAFHEGGQVILEIEDDGGGIDVERVKRKAVSNGLITQEQSARMSERDACGLIFAAGLSTAQQVTNISGRGVGMDVVKSNIEKIGGQIDIANRFQRGLTLRIKIPLTLAIIPALIVTAGNERFAIPQVSLIELVRLEGEARAKSIDSIEGAPVYRLRGRLLPLVFLDRELGLAPQDGDTINIVILQADGRQFGLVVHRICDTEEIVVKPLTKLLKSIPVFAGATIMGDGRVALILDVLGVAQRSRVLGDGQERAVAAAEADRLRANSQRKRLLLFQVGEDLRMAAPLEAAARLEEFQRADIENSGDLRVVQYRGEILPLLPLAAVFGRTSSLAQPERTSVQAVVARVGGRSYALVVERILDIVEQELKLDPRSRRGVVCGTSVIQSKVTDMIDIAAAVRQLDPSANEAAALEEVLA